ncbi:hypothetical protein [Nocardioides sp.]|uniref:hypothetical protein n=1 Tax=Nocardioides sp. TaxID=35761 RepID=UPI00271F20AB|nr:hypothetical protein [Nocardioides sp.]MDO9457435.1 hypothetical protein [Nocardioides sp.]
MRSTSRVFPAGRVPEVDAGGWHVIGPGGEGLGAVVSSAEAGDVGGLGLAVGAAAGVLGCVVGDAVVAVGAASGAEREHAASVSEVDLFGEGGARDVAVGGQVGVEVDDGLDGDLGAGRLAPGEELLEEDRGVGVVEERDVGGVEVGVEGDSTPTVGRSGWFGGTGGEVEGELGSGDLPGGSGAAHVEGLGGAEVGELSGGRTDRCVQVEGVGQVEVAVDLGDAVEEVGSGEVDVEVLVLFGFLASSVGFEGCEVGQGRCHGALDLGLDHGVGAVGEGLVDLGGAFEG